MTKAEVLKDIKRQIAHHMKHRNYSTVQAFSWALLQSWERESIKVTLQDLRNQPCDIKAYQRLCAIHQVYDMLYLV